VSLAPPRAGGGFSVQSWVRAECAAIDPVLHDAVLAWLERDWPFDSIEYAPRTWPAPAAGCLPHSLPRARPAPSLAHSIRLTVRVL
jgi:hypothetical protein